MIETEIIESRQIGSRLYNVLVDLYEFTVLLVRVLLEVFIAGVQHLTKKEQKDVSGEIIVITGTGHGIGRELALQYTDLGATVVCVDINETGNQQTVSDCNRLQRGTAHAYTCDVSNREKVLELAIKVKIEVGPVTVLINNAGIMPTRPLEKQTPEEIRKTFDINVLSNFWTLEAFLPHMREQNRGHIVSMSSIAGVIGLSNLVPYCASKFAVRGMMESLQEEIREGPHKNLIKTTTIYPYMTNTGLCKNPKVKFPKILGLLDPKQVASKIIEGQRTDVAEMTIPRGLLYLNNVCRNFPRSCAELLKDYVDSGVYSD